MNPGKNEVSKPDEFRSYWSVVWSQLKQYRLAVLGIYCIGFLLLVAICAPLIALDRPFWYMPPESAGPDKSHISFPFFPALFDIRHFENAVDFFFNTWLVVLPFAILAWIVTKKALGRKWRQKRKYFALAVLVVQSTLFMWLWYDPYELPYRNYTEEIAEYEAEGKNPGYLFPLLPYSFREVDLSESLSPPSEKHPLGTDREGRDVFVRMVYGTRISLTIGVVAVGLYVIIGTILGSLAGYFGGWVDILISRFVEIMLCFPAFFLMLTLAAFIEQRSIFHIMFIIGVTRWTGVARLVRGEFLRQRNLDYVQAAVALGLGKARVIFAHVLPNAVAPVLVAATFGMARAVLIESSLSFLGLGDPTAPSWGSILSAGRAEFKLWLILVPGFAIFFVVSMFNLVGEGLRDALDPKLRQ